ncbi:MAG: hypothetical protein CL920_34330 [Deltaproteobacteria bacterium]|nr:hypothetical protein [Deltaproteobacteria bacterium]MBU53802.1 hypothetical protein [Deltaproteobacteria bacterium]|tara:strand:+ start:7055 stop:8428 length:1374 start_codon:yes stop_codon:yes gene_type:complete
MKQNMLRWGAKISILFLAVSFAFVGCSDNSEEQKKQTNNQAITYHKDVRPLIEKKCNNCHKKGGVGPMIFNTYDLLKQSKDAIKASIVAKRMPPWPADTACREYDENKGLSDEQIKTITQWVDNGAPEGDEKDYKAPEVSGPKGLSRVDVSLKLPEPYTPKLAPDDYHCFVLDWPEKEKMYVTGFNFKPDNKAIVHHVIVYIAPPGSASDKAVQRDKDEDGVGYTCYGGPRTDAAMVAVWAPGLDGRDYPKGTGIKVMPGSKVILQVHYNVNPATKGQKDQSSVELKLDYEVDAEAYVTFYNGPTWTKKGGMPIPKNKADVMHNFSTAPHDVYKKYFGDKRIVVHGASLHMHQLGTKGTMYYTPKGGSSEQCLVNIPKWDFNWQFFYFFDKPLIVNPGDQLGIRCHFNNSQSNQPYVNGKQKESQYVEWGDGTDDEMCLGTFYISCQNPDGTPTNCL